MLKRYVADDFHPVLTTSTGAYVLLGGNRHLDLTKMAQNFRDDSPMHGTHVTVVLNIVNAIQERVFVVHQIRIRVEVRVGLQVKLRVTGLRILRLRVRVRGILTRKAK